MKVESAFAMAVPEAEPLVKTFRNQYDTSAALGAPAHITILYPFMSPYELTPFVLGELKQFFGTFSAFEFALTEVRCFPEILYLVPSPAEPFKVLTQAIVERYPDYPPYSGGFSEIIPHLTIAEINQPNQLAALEREFMHLHGVQLPVKAIARELMLIENSSVRWEVKQIFKLASNTDCARIEGKKRAKRS